MKAQLRAKAEEHRILLNRVEAMTEVMADFGQTDFGQFFDRLWPTVVLTDFGQTDFGQF